MRDACKGSASGVERVDGGADEACVIGLDCEDAARIAKIGGAGQGTGCTVVGGDADIFEDIGADEEKGIAGKGVEGGTDSSTGSEGVEGVDQIDGGLSDGGCAESSAQEGDVLAFFDGSFCGVGFDGWVREGYGGKVSFGSDGALGACAGDAKGG